MIVEPGASGQEFCQCHLIDGILSHVSDPSHEKTPHGGAEGIIGRGKTAWLFLVR